MHTQNLHSQNSPKWSFLKAKSILNKQNITLIDKVSAAIYFIDAIQIFGSDSLLAQAIQMSGSNRDIVSVPTLDEKNESIDQIFTLLEDLFQNNQPLIHRLNPKDFFLSIFTFVSMLPKIIDGDYTEKSVQWRNRLINFLTTSNLAIVIENLARLKESQIIKILKEELQQKPNLKINQFLARFYLYKIQNSVRLGRKILEKDLTECLKFLKELFCQKIQPDQESDKAFIEVFLQLCKIRSLSLSNANGNVFSRESAEIFDKFFNEIESSFPLDLEQLSHLSLDNLYYSVAVIVARIYFSKQITALQLADIKEFLSRVDKLNEYPVEHGHLLLISRIFSRLKFNIDSCKSGQITEEAQDILKAYEKLFLFNELLRGCLFHSNEAAFKDYIVSNFFTNSNSPETIQTKLNDVYQKIKNLPTELAHVCLKDLEGYDVNARLHRVYESLQHIEKNNASLSKNLDLMEEALAELETLIQENKQALLNNKIDFGLFSECYQHLSELFKKNNQLNNHELILFCKKFLEKQSMHQNFDQDQLKQIKKDYFAALKLAIKKDTDPDYPLYVSEYVKLVISSHGDLDISLKNYLPKLKKLTQDLLSKFTAEAKDRTKDQSIPVPDQVESAYRRDAKICLDAISAIDPNDQDFAKLQREYRLRTYQLIGYRKSVGEWDCKDNYMLYEKYRNELIEDLDPESSEAFKQLLMREAEQADIRLFPLFYANLTLPRLLNDPNNSRNVSNFLNDLLQNGKGQYFSATTLNQFQKMMLKEVTPYILRLSTRFSDVIFLPNLLKIFLKYRIQDDAAIHSMTMRLISTDTLVDKSQGFDLENIIKQLQFKNQQLKQRLIDQIQMAKKFIDYKKYFAWSKNYPPPDIQSNLEGSSNIFAPYYFAQMLKASDQSKKDIIAHLESALKKGVEIAADELSQYGYSRSKILSLLFNTALKLNESNDPSTRFIVSKLNQYAQTVKGEELSSIGLFSNISKKELSKKEKESLREAFFVAYAQQNKSRKNLSEIRKKNLSFYLDRKKELEILESIKGFQSFSPKDPKEVVDEWRDLALQVHLMITKKDVNFFARVNQYRPCQMIGESLHSSTYLWEILDDICELQANCVGIDSNDDLNQLLALMIKELGEGKKPKPSDELKTQLEKFKKKREGLPQAIAQLKMDIANVKKTSNSIANISLKEANLTKIKELELHVKTLEKNAKEIEKVEQNLETIEALATQVSELQQNADQAINVSELIADLIKRANEWQNFIEDFCNSYRSTCVYDDSASILNALNFDVRVLVASANQLKKDYFYEKDTAAFNIRLELVSTDIENFSSNINYQILKAKKDRLLEDVQTSYSNLPPAYGELFPASVPLATPEEIQTAYENLPPAYNPPASDKLYPAPVSQTAPEEVHQTNEVDDPYLRLGKIQVPSTPLTSEPTVNEPVAAPTFTTYALDTSYLELERREQEQKATVDKLIEANLVAAPKKMAQSQSAQPTKNQSTFFAQQASAVPKPPVVKKESPLTTFSLMGWLKNLPSQLKFQDPEQAKPVVEKKKPDKLVPS